MSRTNEPKIIVTFSGKARSRPERRDPITPLDPEPELPIRGRAFTFRKRMDDFIWGTSTGDLVCDEGYRIYISSFRPTWRVKLGSRVLGEYPDLHRAIQRAEDHHGA